MANTTPSTQPVDYFVSRLETLDAGGRARLKRNAGRPLGEARDAYQVFFSILPFQVASKQDQETYFLIATLYAVGTRRENPRPHNPPPSFGASLRRIRGDSDERRVSLDKRFGALLEADREQLPFRLRQLVSLLAANEIAVDWRQLLRDVRYWTHDEGFVQRRWAEDYFVGSHAMTEAAPNAALESIATTTQGA